ncbi:peptidase M24, structural domain-containing protein [Piptocephalis cylindrospora]|uniref:Peptidase M24, structural domain-containing protein n=1 Tax=Piptocephalis cylindrospora TaxID=1907219 RepID=A0A4V1IY10_9FUNG|nr:peptidase M24, structural domain-containing protein [Piptocephalis cylindrospora]|eukprot:RKP12929.1 peptidase M24, structural domain-containing protein [Piptocephalis cylindrospora]
MSSTTVPEGEAVDYTIKNSDVVTKYRTAAVIADAALVKVMDACVPGAKIIDLCSLGDRLLGEGTKAVYAKGSGANKISKGIAFPTCVSVNHVICHFSPLPSDPEAAEEIQDGDMVKIELGAQIDGFAAVTAHTVVVGATKEAPVTGKKADALKAAYLASEAALRLIREGKKNSDVTETLQTITNAFGVKSIEGMLSHQQERNLLDGKKTIILNPSDQNRNYERCDFAVGDVWTVDVLVSTGDAKPKDSTYRTTVHKKTTTSYQLKMAASRKVYSEVTSKFGQFPFTLRAMEDERKARMGIQECAKRSVVDAYDVYTDQKGETVAQFIFTVLLTANGPVRITPSHWNDELVQSEHKIEDPEIVKLLNSGLGTKKNKKKKAAAAQEAEKQ